MFISTNDGMLISMTDTRVAFDFFDVFVFIMRKVNTQKTLANMYLCVLIHNYEQPSISETGSWKSLSKII